MPLELEDLQRVISRLCRTVIFNTFSNGRMFYFVNTFYSLNREYAARNLCSKNGEVYVRTR